MTSISVDDLKLINMIACQGSFAKAADMLNLTRPGVSRRIKSIEEILQISLFKRTTRQLELTDEGRRFVEHTMAMEQLWIQAIGEIHNQKAELKGKLTVCSLDLIHRRLAQYCLTDFITQYPQIDLKLLTSYGRPEANKFDADLILHISPIKEQSFISDPLIECHWPFFASPAYLAKNGVPQHPSELGAYHTIECYDPEHESESGTWRWYEDELSHKVKIESRMQCDELEVAMHMALNNCGIAWLPDFLGRQYVAEGRLVALFDGKYADPVQIYAIYPRSQYYPSITQAFIHFMRYNKLFGEPLPSQYNATS
ncbi:LysR family transcriptional regulator [Shewanella canadensis]|uniref:LysR family transcriptional regulator n=1 Tax=Shewanella canadensis TaxID=271096 RepID=A0A3S0LMU0_9GAMM|nr:LysR family transcriptional regulator [Shewanella canadensis]RTR39208.1 LysR family transcriptional regulator [Shewanella canadensis]